MFRRRWAVALATALLGTSLGLPTVQAGGIGTTTRYVDDSGPGQANCGSPSSVLPTIQAAIDASDENDRIIVCPGLYSEQLDIGPGHNGLRVTSRTKWGAIIRTPSALVEPILVSIHGSDRVRFQDFKVQVLTEEPCDQLAAAIAVDNASGAQIIRNRIVAIGEESLGDCGYMIGVAVGNIEFIAGWFSGLLTSTSTAAVDFASATVRHNTVKDFKWLGIGAPPGTRSTIKRNRVRYLHSGQVADIGLSTSTLRHPSVAGLLALRDLVAPSGTPEGFFGLPMGIAVASDTLVTGNHVTSGPRFFRNTLPNEEPVSDAPVLFTGISLMSYEGSPPVRILRNKTGRTIIGLLVLSGDTAIIRRNSININIAGILLIATVDSTIDDNDQYWALAGISVADDDVGAVIFGSTDPSSGNTFTDNRTSYNFLVHCFDDSNGGWEDPAIDNTWTGNVIVGPVLDEVSNPSGICVPAP